MKQKMVKTMFFLSMLLLVSLCGACEKPVPQYTTPTTSPPQDAAVPGGERKIKVGFLMDTLEEERWLKDKRMFKEAVEEIGAEVEIMVANGDEVLQIIQAETLIKQGVDVLVMVPYNAEAAGAIVQKAHLAGIKVISYDRLVKNAEIDLYVSFDNEEVGELQAKALTALVPKGKYVYIGGADTDYNAHLLKKGVFNVLKPLIDKGDIKIVYDQWTKNWIPINAYSNMEAALQANNYEIDAVFAGNDATAEEAVKVLSRYGLAGKVPVAGQDAELAAIRRIVNGTQTMTVYKPIKSLTSAAAKAAVQMAEGENIVTERKINNGKIEVPSILLPPISVDKNNIAETVIADGFHSKEEIYHH
ncbi:substrate-binding domain-containing protein [Robertmurraya sp. DFI.2.37]|jgi:D-xylose transport system substrate-binding protein|uniref:sugar ABC transporter substrate-binding protein n=1 Tax=Robertmurraya sp. DFI.2.37 TaxID=3031819 RepID=UPI001248C20E|nr:substrate-binding domain-containing protein [Robertmurraya sp. DFI.2.37]MDF1510888.1 substrate-binding domain-containing protein [Robertmurraya sp. DFI.2.37]